MENDDNTYTIDINTMSSIGDITINIDNNAYNTTYLSDNTITISNLTGDDYTFVLDDGTIDLSNITSVNWPLDNTIDPDEVERMCKEYPGLEKTWRNFKATYDLVKQDWKGKQDDDDEFPF